MLTPGRSYTNGTGYRYGFGGQENDGEVKGEGNSLDYGARIYDPRLGRWLSADPLANGLPQFSPYASFEKSPLRNVDPDGKFTIPIHIAITQRAIAALQQRGVRISVLDKYPEMVTVGLVDVTQMNNNTMHFDNHRGYDQIKNTMDDLRQGITDATSPVEIGAMLHTVQDFYSHSNYIELYTEFYKQKGGDPSKLQSSDIPLFNEASPEFKEYLQKQGDRFRTGKYKYGILHTITSLFKEKILKKKDLDPESHEQMNKDNTKTPEGQKLLNPSDPKSKTLSEVAQDLAQRQTEDLLEKNKEATTNQ